MRPQIEVSWSRRGKCSTTPQSTMDDQEARRRTAEPQEPAGDDRFEGPRFRDFFTAVGVLTCLPWSRPDPKSAAYGRSTPFFPLVGLCIGAALAGLQRLLVPALPRWIVAPLVVGLWERLAGGPSIRPLREWCLRGTNGGKPSGSTSDPFAPSSRPSLAAYRGAVLAAITCAVAKVLALAVPASIRPAALLFAPMLARWGLVVLMVGARDAAAPAQKFNVAITFREFALASVFSFVALFAVAEAFGIFIAACVAALTLAIRLLAHRRLGGVSWPLLQLTGQLIETIVVVLFALP
jgi:adenosylcobinamide-GDP ribazoletransferase